MYKKISDYGKWYGSDFGGTVPERLRSIASYLYTEDDKVFIMKNAEDLRITYQDYDRKLNRN